MIARLTGVVVLAIGSVACSVNTVSRGSGTGGGSPDTATVKATVEAANARFLDAFKRGDKAVLSPITPMTRLS